MSLSRFAAIVLLATLSACGFQLQGAASFPAEMERTYIEAGDQHSLFYRALRRDMQAAGVHLVDSLEEATAVFTVYYDYTNQRVLSVSARNVPTEYEVFYTIQYGLQSGDVALVDVQEMTVTRDYTYDATLVLGKEKEEAILRDAIVEDLVQIVRRQISAH
jgi:LPS-assembly lipoprotein